MNLSQSNNSDKQEKKDHNYIELKKFLENIKEKGVNLSSENNKLHLDAPKGRLTEDDLNKIKQNKEEIIQLLQKQDTGIAIIGLGCRFPGAKNPEAFWELLHNGVDAITQVPDYRWNLDDFYDPIPLTPGKMNTRFGGFLEPKYVQQFDPQFFGISGREAEIMDPQQRLLLEVSWEALENAGLSPKSLTRSNTGVFVGICISDYSKYSFGVMDIHSGTGNALSIAANRISYLLDLRGPSMSIDTSCSSSLVATHQACQSLLSKECNLSIVGGVNIILNPELSVVFSQSQMLSPDGRCKTFDKDANGYVRGEGCGVVVLKRLSDAIENRNNILAVIKGSAINQDGRSNGITAPNGPSQEAVIRQALKNAKIEPAQISYVETHGTGTSLGDPIEVNSLKNVLMQNRSLDQTCWLGAVKTNIGHLEGSAGIASLIKAVLCLQHEEIPSNVHFNQLNPYINIKDTCLSIPTKNQKWNSDKQKRFAGVSSFGFGGTNSHIILTQAPVKETRKSKTERPQHILTLSAKTKKALSDLSEKYIEFLTEHPQASLADICFTASAGRSHFDYRLSAISKSHDQLIEQLKDFSKGKHHAGLITGQVNNTTPSKIAFIFTGQGSQYIGMGKQLYETQPCFKKTLDQCAEILKPHLQQPLLEVINSKSPDSILHQTSYTQPALFALEYALFKLWESWGINPDVVMGHSVGEYVAACVAGVFSLEHGLKLIATRGRLMQKLPKNGAMVAVMASKEQVAACVEPYLEKVSIAAFNGPDSLVVSGEKQAVKTVCNTLKDQGVKTVQLQVSHAFHSPLMDPMLKEFKAALDEITFFKPSLKLISNLTGQIATDNISNSQYWINHTRKAVQFNSSMKTLDNQGYKIFLECGPKPVLLGMGRLCLPENQGLWLPSLRTSGKDWQQILQSLGKLYVSGANIEWYDFDKDYSRNKLILPTYPWQKQKYWLNNILNLQSSIQSESIQFESKHSLTNSDTSSKQKTETTEEAAMEILKAGIPDIESFDIDTPFQSLGLDSLILLSLRQRIQAKFGIKLEWDLFLENNSPKTLLKYIKENALTDEDSDKDQFDLPDFDQTRLETMIWGSREYPERWYNLPEKNKLPILINITNLRHGSSLTNLILNAHPDLFAPQGLYLLPYTNLKERKQELEKQPLFLEQGLYLTVQELWKVEQQEAIEIVDEWIAQNLPIQKVYQMLQEKCAPKILVDRGTIYGINTKTLERAEKIFENVKYLHLIRHPYSVMNSGTIMIKKTLMFRNMISYFEDVNTDRVVHKVIDDQWGVTHTNALMFFEKIEKTRWHRIKFEDMVSKPEEILKGVCDFLEIPFDRAMLNPYDIEENVMLHNKTGEFGVAARDPKLMKRSQIDPSGADSWKKNIPSLPISPFTQHVASSFGYKLPGILLTETDKQKVLVRLNSVESGVPVFFIPGSGGNIHPFFEVGKSLKRPAWALKILDYTPLDSVESLAAFFVNFMVNKIDKSCSVVGFSSGAPVAWEIANQMKQKSVKVEKLIMVDRDPFDSSSVRGVPENWNKEQVKDHTILALVALSVESGLALDRAEQLWNELIKGKADGTDLQDLFENFIDPIKLEKNDISEYLEKHRRQRDIMLNFRPSVLDDAIKKIVIWASYSTKSDIHEGIEQIVIENCNHFSIWKSEKLRKVMSDIFRV